MESIRYSLGLDIGIASVGFAVIRNDLNGEPIKIERLGVRVFDRAEQPKTGASLALPRRQARGARRVIRRRRHRKERIKWLIEDSGLMSRPEQDALLGSGAFDKSVYELRVEALDRRLSDDEAVRLLIHFAQRRGYKSNSKAEEAKDAAESGKLKSAISANRQRMEENGYRTVGEMFWRDPLFKRTEADGRQILVVHNQPGEYKVTVERAMLLEELGLIFARQRELGATWASEQFEAAYTDIWSSQRNFDEGPGGDSPYGGSQIGRMLGKCTFEKELDRAPKASYTAEYFRLLQTANNLKIVGRGQPAEFLDEEQRKIFIELAFSSASATYTQLRKKLALPDDLNFNHLYYGEKSKEEIEKKKIGMMPFYHKLRTALNKVEKGAVEKLSVEQRDQIAMILLLYKSDDNRTAHLREAAIPEEYIPVILELSTSKAGHLSALAMQKLLPYLEQGYTYDKACKEVYGSHDGKQDTERTRKLRIDMAGEITNPVVRRAISQSIKVINAIVREYGPPETVRIELARELGKSFDERNKQEKRINENAARNEQAREQIREYKRDDPTGLDIVKFKLFQEQNGVCLYSGKNLDISRLFEAGYVDVDHIIPYSDSFDDSYANKVLVLASENRQKGNRIPFAYFGSDAERWNRFETLVGTQIRSFRKRKNLLLRTLNDDQSKGLRERNLKDTQYLSRAIFRLIDDNLEFAQTGNYKRKTQTVSGAITAQVRKRLGIDKIRENGDLHHAADAAVIACISPGMVQKVTNYAKRCELYRDGQGYIDYETGEVMTREAFDEKYAPRFPEPWPMFRKELEARLSADPRAEIEHLNLPGYDSDEELRPVFVSRMPRHKVTGAAHMETIRSGKVPGSTVTKTDLTNLKLDKNGEIAGYYRPEDDPLLYEALKARLREFGNDPKKAFAEPFHKPKHDGTPGPLVKKVKIVSVSPLNVQVNGGLAANGGMIRVDVFHVEDDGYYFVPIYISDTVKDQLPNRAPVAHKPYSEWKVMRDEDFLFSMYSGDLIRVSREKEITIKAPKGSTGEPIKSVKDSLFYFCEFDRASAAFSVQLHDRSYEGRGLGKTVSLIEKYQVDVLGNYAPVRLPEKRMGFR